jgi:hypothetical protein
MSSRETGRNFAECGPGTKGVTGFLAFGVFRDGGRARRDMK